MEMQLSPLKFYKITENIWFKIPEKIRFLLVGGFNTVVSYLIFALLYEIVGLHYNVALVVQYMITINMSVLTMRYYVFRSSGDFWREFTKAWSVYIFIFFFNAAMLNLFVKVMGLPPLIAQGLYLIISTVTTFILHKYLSFRKSGKE